MNAGERRDYLRLALDITEEQDGPPGDLRLVIVSESMAPLLRPGDAVFVRPQDSYQTGDILSFRSKDQVITHRLVKRVGKRLILKGDRGRRSDPPIEKAAVLGRVVALERAGLRQDTPEGRLNTWIARLSGLEARIFETISGTAAAPRLDNRLGVLLSYPARRICSFLIDRLALK